MRKRLFSFFLAFVLFLGCVGYRPQRVYANAIAPTVAYEILYALLGTMGAVGAVGGTHAEKIKIAEHFRSGLDGPGLEAFNLVLDALELDAATGIYRFGASVARDTLVDLYNSAYSTLASYVSFSPPIAGYTSFTVSDDNVESDKLINRLNGATCVDSPFVVTTSSDGLSSSVFAFLPNGYYLVYDVDEIGKTTIEWYRYVGFDESLTLKIYSRLKDHNYVSFLVSGRGYGTSGSLSFVDGGIAYGYAGKLYSIGSPNVGASAYFEGLKFGTADLVDCDTWVDNWVTSLESDKSQVGFVTGQDLGGYNTRDEIYDGLITGVDVPSVPDVPDVPVTPDVPDLSGISGLLQSILSWLKALPAAFVDAFLGEPVLNFDALKINNFITKFPFCVPYDLYNCIAQLVVPPAPPVFTLSFDGTIMASAGDIVIDLSKFDGLAKIIRFFVFFGFVAALIKITRNLIKG